MVTSVVHIPAPRRVCQLLRAPSAPCLRAGVRISVDPGSRRTQRGRTGRDEGMMAQSPRKATQNVTRNATRKMTRLSILGAVVLGLAATVGTAAPARAGVSVTCASINASQGSVFGFLCTGATSAPQRGTIAD